MFHVLVIDSSTARLFQCRRAKPRLLEIYDFVNPSGHKHEQELVSSRPGRVVNRAAGMRHALGHATSARRYAIERWTQSLSKQLRELLAARRSQGLVLVGSSRLLASVRKGLPKTMPVYATVARNLGHVPASTLAERLLPILDSVERQLDLRTKTYRPAAAVGKTRTATRL